MTGDFERFMQERTPRLLRLARVLTGNQQDAEDLTQEALLRMHAQWKRVSGAADATAYSNRVMVNCHLDGRRRRGASVVRLVDSDLSTHDSTNDVDDRLAMRDALANLPVRQRTIVVLRYYEQLNTKEIGEMMGIGESSVRSALARALSSMKSEVADHPTA